MVVAVTVVLSVEVAVHQVADVVAMRNHGVATVLTVRVITCVLVAEVFWGAAVRMVGIDRQYVLLDAGVGDVVQVPVVHVVVVVVVSYELVLTVEAVHVIVRESHVVLRSAPISRAWARPTSTRSLTCSSASE